MHHWQWSGMLVGPGVSSACGLQCGMGAGSNMPASLQDTARVQAQDHEIDQCTAD